MSTAWCAGGPADLIVRHEEFGVSVSDDTIYRALKARLHGRVPGPSGLQAGRRTPMARFQKNFALRVAEIRATLPPGTPVEIWVQDEDACRSEENNSPIAGPEKALRPRAIHDQRTRGPVRRGTAPSEPALPSALLATPRPCSSISTKSQRKSPRAHTPVLILDQAGWQCAPSTCRLPKTSRSCRCRRVRRSSTPKKISGNSCGKLAVEPHLQILRDEIVDHCCLTPEYLYPSTLENHVHRLAAIWAIAGHLL